MYKKYARVGTERNKAVRCRCLASKKHCTRSGPREDAVYLSGIATHRRERGLGGWLREQLE